MQSSKYATKLGVGLLGYFFLSHRFSIYEGKQPNVHMAVEKFEFVQWAVCLLERAFVLWIHIFSE